MAQNTSPFNRPPGYGPIHAGDPYGLNPWSNRASSTGKPGGGSPADPELIQQRIDSAEQSGGTASPDGMVDEDVYGDLDAGQAGVATGNTNRPIGAGAVDAYHSGLGYGQPDAVPENTAEVPAVEEAAEEAFVDEDVYQDFGGDDDQRVFASAGGSGNVNQQGIADRFGYQRGQSGLGGLVGAGLMFAGIPGGSFIGDALGGDKTYGNFGTTDAQGNVFGEHGRAYDPLTGRAVGSYRDRGAFKDAITGSYGNLRAAGENPISAGLGSYENSIYNFGAGTPGVTDAQARAARLRGGDYENTGVSSIAGLVNQNTYGINEGYGYGQVDPGLAAAAPGSLAPSHVITGADLGLINPNATTSGQWGSGTGDLAATEFGPGRINDSGQIETRGGTVVQLSDTSNPGGPGISLLNGPSEAAFDELDRRSGRSDDDGQSSWQQHQTQQSINQNQDSYEQEAFGHQDSGGGNDDSGGGK